MPKRVKHRVITALFSHLAEAISAYDWLKELGYKPHEINVLMSDKIAPKFHAIEGDDMADENNLPSKGSYTTGIVGAGIGAGLVAALAAGLGFLAGGPLGAALAGSIPGAMVGGLVGGLVGYGFPEGSANQYDKAVKEGEIALGVDVKSQDHLQLIRTKFESLHAHNIVLI